MKSENWKSFYGPCYLKRLDLPTQTFRLTASLSGWFNEKNPDYEFVVFFCCGFKNIIRCSTVNGCQVLPAVHKRSTLHQFSTFCYIKKVTGVSEEFTSQSNYCSRSHIVRCFQSLVFLLIFFLTSLGYYLTISVFFLLTTNFAKNFCDFRIYLRLFGFLSIKLSIFSRRNFIIFIFCLRRIAWLKPNLDHKKRRNTVRWKYQFYVNTRSVMTRTTRQTEVALTLMGGRVHL